MPDPTTDGLEIERSIVGNEIKAPAKTTINNLLTEGLFSDFVLNISPDKNKIAKVPTATAN